jgi:hypothetical protein
MEDMITQEEFRQSLQLPQFNQPTPTKLTIVNDESYYEVGEDVALTDDQFRRQQQLLASMQLNMLTGKETPSSIIIFCGM